MKIQLPGALNYCWQFFVMLIKIIYIEHTLSMQKFNVAIINICYRPRWITVNGTMYRPGCYVVYGFKNILPQFAAVKEIILLCGEPLLIVILCADC